MTVAADIRRAIERAGVRGFARRAGCAPAAVQRLVERGAYPERGPHGEAMRAAVAEVLAEPEPSASPDAGGGPAVPGRFTATARFLAGPAMQAAELPELLVGVALATLAKDCGYTLESASLVPAPEAPEAP